MFGNKIYGSFSNILFLFSVQYMMSVEGVLELPFLVTVEDCFIIIFYSEVFFYLT